MMTTEDLRRALVQSDPRLSKFDPLPRILFHDDFDEGAHGWAELIGNHDGNLDNVRPIMADLVHRTRETCYLCVADQGQCLYIDKVECSQPIRIIHQIGQRNPMHCTGVGKALLSGMADVIIDRLIAMQGLNAHTRCTITDRHRLKQEIEGVRRTGIALDSEELNAGVKCVAAPVWDNSGKVVAAISLSGPKQRFTAAAIGRFEKEVRDASMAISRASRGCWTPASVRTAILWWYSLWNS